MPYYKVEIVFRSEPGQLDSVTLTVNASTEHDAEIAGVGRALELFPQRAIQVVGVALDVELRDLTEMGIAAYAQHSKASPTLDRTDEHRIDGWRARCSDCGTKRAMLAHRPCVVTAQAADTPAGKYKIEDTFAALRSKMTELEEEIRLLVLKCAHDADYIHELEGERDHERDQAAKLKDELSEAVAALLHEDDAVESRVSQVEQHDAKPAIRCGTCVHWQRPAPESTHPPICALDGQSAHPDASCLSWRR